MLCIYSSISTHIFPINSSAVLSRISVENIEVEFSSLYVRTKTLEEKVRGDQELQQQLEPFLQVTQQNTESLMERLLSHTPTHTTTPFINDRLMYSCISVPELTSDSSGPETTQTGAAQGGKRPHRFLL